MNLYEDERSNPTENTSCKSFTTLTDVKANNLFQYKLLKNELILKTFDVYWVDSLFI